MRTKQEVRDKITELIKMGLSSPLNSDDEAKYSNQVDILFWILGSDDE